MSDRPARPSPEALARYADEFNKSRPLQYFGVKISFPGNDKVRAELAVKPEHVGGLGTTAVNGGVLAAIFDLVIGCTPALVDPTRRTATMQLSMSFMRPMVGERIYAEASIDCAGGSTLFASATFYDDKDQPCA